MTQKINYKKTVTQPLQSGRADYTEIAPWLRFYIFFSMVSIGTTTPQLQTTEINGVKINTTFSLSPFCLCKAVVLWPLFQQKVHFKMSNKPPVLLSCVVCAPHGWKYDAWAGQSRGQRWGLGWGLGNCQWTALLLNAMETAHSSQRWYCLIPWQWHKGDLGPWLSSRATVLSVGVGRWEKLCAWDWSIWPIPHSDPLELLCMWGSSGAEPH